MRGEDTGGGAEWEGVEGEVQVVDGNGVAGHGGGVCTVHRRCYATQSLFRVSFVLNEINTEFHFSGQKSDEKNHVVGATPHPPPPDPHPFLHGGRPGRGAGSRRGHGSGGRGGRDSRDCARFRR